MEPYPLTVACRSCTCRRSEDFLTCIYMTSNALEESSDGTRLQCHLPDLRCLHGRKSFPAYRALFLHAYYWQPETACRLSGNVKEPEPRAATAPMTSFAGEDNSQVQYLKMNISTRCRCNLLCFVTLLGVWPSYRPFERRIAEMMFVQIQTPLQHPRPRLLLGHRGGEFRP